SQPRPPPSVRPAIPVVETRPPVVASPKACVSRSNSPQVTPASARAVLPCGSTRTLFIGDRSIISPPSQTALPDTLWPPPRTDTNKPLFRGEIDGGNHIGGPGPAGDNRGSMLDHCVVDFACRIVSIVVPKQMTTAQSLMELLDRLCLQHNVATPRRRDFDIRHVRSLPHVRNIALPYQRRIFTRSVMNSRRFTRSLRSRVAAATWEARFRASWRF